MALLKKDLLLELRQQHTLYGILLYIASTIFVIFLSMGDTVLEANIWNALFWVIQLFICVNAVAKSFLQESKGRMLYFYSIVSPTEFIIAKLLYNIVIMMLMSAIAAKAQQNAALVAILGFPVILPLLLLLMRLSKTAFNEIFKEGALLQLAGLIVGLDALIIAMAVVLFPYLWKE